MLKWVNKPEIMKNCGNKRESEVRTVQQNEIRKREQIYNNINNGSSFTFLNLFEELWKFLRIRILDKKINERADCLTDQLLTPRYSDERHIRCLFMLSWHNTSR